MAAEDLIRELRSGRPAERWQAATRLVDAARAQQAETLEALGAALGDSHPFVRWRAGLSLVQAGRPRALAVLVDALHKGPTQRQAAAADALACGRKINAKPLLRALASEEAGVRQSAAEALGRLSYRPALSDLITLLDDASPWVRRAAIRALGHIGGRSVIGPVILRLNDEFALVRGSAAYALGAMRARQAASSLIVALNDPNPLVRRNAAWALGRLGDRRALPKLRELQADLALDGRVAREAQAAIEAIGQPVWQRLAQLVHKGSARRAVGKT